MTSTFTYSYTRTHTATHLTEVILGTITDILADLGINMDRFHCDWVQNENAIKAWIEEGSLTQVVLECHRPSGTVDPVIEFPVSYTASGTGDAEFTASRARLSRFRAKLDRVPPAPPTNCSARSTVTTVPRTGGNPAHEPAPMDSAASPSGHSAPHRTPPPACDTSTAKGNPWDTSTTPSAN